MRQYGDFIAAEVTSNDSGDDTSTFSRTAVLGETWNMRVAAMVELWRIRHRRATPETASGPPADIESLVDGDAVLDEDGVLHAQLPATLLEQDGDRAAQQTAQSSPLVTEPATCQTPASVPESQVPQSPRATAIASMPAQGDDDDARDLQALMDALDACDEQVRHELAQWRSLGLVAEPSSAVVSVSIKPSRAARRPTRSYLIYPK